MLRFAVMGACALMMAGCAKPPHEIRDRSDYLAEATRIFPGETRERVLRAAETVLRLSDPNDFEFRYTLTGLTGLRRYMVYAVLAVQQGREKWDVTTEQGPGGIQASVSISEAGVVSGSGSANIYENGMASVPLYRLFWSRVEYVLNRRTDWKTCNEARDELEETKTNTVAALGGLCGSTSDGRDAPPPPQMPKMVLLSDKTLPPASVKKKR
jgi:hypothetical protein